MDADGSNRRILTETFDRSPRGILWAPDESGIYLNVESDGWRNLYFVPLTGGVRPVTKGSQLLTVTSVNKRGETVGVSSTLLKPNDVVALSVKVPTIRQLTAVNDDFLAGKTLGQVEAFWYPTADGMKIQGWIIKPPGFDAKKKYSLMLSIRGGPRMCVGNVKTPTMRMTGVNDVRAPISQTEEFNEALEVRKVPTAMIRFNDEWHGTSSRPSNYPRTQLYLRSWFEQYATKDDKVAVQ